MEYKPHPYQQNAVEHVVGNPFAGLILDMGLGKTSIVLTALEELHSSLEINKVLVVAPRRVADHSWDEEINKWDHLKHLRLSKIIGTAAQRIAAFNADADIYTVSRDNICWMIHHCAQTKKFPFDVIVVDESSSFKNRASQRFKALRKVIPKVKRVIILTGTPTPLGLLDLWSQIYLLDQGERLGKTFSIYKDSYFTPGAQNGNIVYQYKLKAGADNTIHEKIKDICLSMTAKDYLQMPDRFNVIEYIELASFKRYEEFKKTEILSLDNGEELTPINAAALYNQLLQFCNGGVYRSDKSYEIVDETKLDTLLEAVEALNGNPVIIFYQFISDRERILAKLPQARTLDNTEMINEWNRGDIPVLVLHAASAGHGLNMQYGGHTVFWFGLGWNLELYQQANARVFRQGQTKPVTIKHFVAKNTVEEIVLKRLEDKSITQDALIEALKRHLY